MPEARRADAGSGLARNAYWVEPGRLLAGPYPRPELLPELVDAGVTAYIDLTQPGSSMRTTT